MLVDWSVVNLPANGVVTPIEELLIVDAVEGLMVTVPVPVGLSVTPRFAGDRDTVPVEVSVVNAPVDGVPDPMDVGAANVAPPSCVAFIAVLHPKPVFVVQIKALAEVLQVPTASAVGDAAPEVAFPTTVFVACVANAVRPTDPGANGLAKSVPLVGSVKLVAPVSVKVRPKPPVVTKGPPTVMVLPPLLMPVPPAVVGRGFPKKSCLLEK